MSELEPQNSSNDALSEILGFDPESGERIEDRGQLQEYKFSKIAVPKEVQSAFAEYIAYTEGLHKDLKDLGGTKIKILPEKLLYILQGEESENGTRTYYSWIQSDEGKIRFHESASAWFWKLGESLIISIDQLGEAADWKLERTQIEFNPQITKCEFRLANRAAEVIFTEEGPILDFVSGIDRFDPFQFDGEYYMNYNTAAKELLKVLAKKGNLEWSDRSSKYDLTVKKDVMKLKRVENGILGDELLIPRKINQEEIIQTLFDHSTLKDPLNAPLELDNSWRFANLMDTVGVKWERY